jgi:two-component system, LuxR family, sensor kinase FixL
VNKHWITGAAIIGLAFLVFVVDALLPEVESTWVFYLPLILLTIRLYNWHAGLLLMIGCSIFTCAAPLAAIQASDPSTEVVNRGLALVAIWLTVSVVKSMRQQSAEAMESQAKQAEQSMRLQLSESVAHLDEAVLVTDSNLDWPMASIAFANPATTRITGYRLSDLIGNTPQLFHDDRDDDTVFDAIRSRLAAGRSFQGRLVIQRRDGEHRDVEAVIAPVRDENDGLTNCVVVLRDTTDLIRTAAALRESEEQMRLAVEAAGIGTYVVDYSANRVHFSPRLLEMLGRPSAVDMTQEEVNQLLHPDDLAQITADSETAFASGINTNIAREIRVYWPNGELRWHSFFGQIEFRDSPKGRQPFRHIGASIDVTDRKRAEIALKQLNETLEKQVAERTSELLEKEARLRAILDTAVSAIVTIDELGVIQSANPATERLFGYTTKELIGQNVKLLMPSPYRDEHDQYLGNYLATGIKHIIGAGRELPALHKDGTEFIVELSVSENTVGPRWYTGILNDITRRKALERQLVQSATQEEQRIGRELHDGVGQELTGLGLLAGALVQRLQHKTQSERQTAEKLATGLERVHEQIRLLGRGLAFAELDAAGLEVALRELAQRITEQSGIACEFACTEPVKVADKYAAKHMYRIAQEATSNAMRHGQPNRIGIALHQGPSGVRLTVQDNGTGLPSSEDVEGVGDGMGIATMRYRAETIGGTLHVGPAEGGGTIVSCVVPWRVGRAKESPQTRATTSENSHRR